MATRAKLRRQYTEREMIGMLQRRYGETAGNGPAWVLIPQVRNAAGHGATNTCDAIAMSLWPSRGLELHGFEIKCDRRDWLRELANPQKMEAFMPYVDRWWIVATDEIVQDGELPPDWGLLVARGERLVTKREADLLPPLPPGTQPPWGPGSKSFLAALLRSAARTHQVTPEEVQTAVDQALSRQREDHKVKEARLKKTIQELNDRIQVFERESGVRLGGIRNNGESEFRWYGQYDPQQVGAALRAVLSGEADTTKFLNRFKSIAEQAQHLADDARRAAGSESP